MYSTPPPASSGASAIKSRKHWTAASPSAAGQSSNANEKAGSGYSRNVNEVATPKLPPPPCSAQNKSGFSVSLAVTCRPSASTSSTDSRLSQARPNFRSSHPDPPPSVRPPTPVVEIRPPVVATPCAWVAPSTAPHVAPPPTTATRASGEIVTELILRRSSTTPSWTRHAPVTL